MDNTFYSSEHSVRFHDEISPKAVVFGKIVDFPFFANYHIPLRELFQAQGWENFISLLQTQYTTLVKHFYTHFQYKEGKITSYVKGKSISLTLNNLATILGVPRTNLQRYTTNDWVQFQGYDPLASIRQMCGNPNIQHAHKPKNTELTIESCLILHIITHNILSRSGSYEYISYLNLFLIWCILNKVKLDLAFYIAWHMDSCVKKKNATLPYGLHITSILEHFEISLSGERETQNVIPMDVYGVTTMKQMKYSLKENIWVKRDTIMEEELDEEAQMERDEAQGDEEAMHVDEEPLTVPQMAPSSSHVNEDNFQLMFGRMDFLTISMENLTTLVTNRFSVYDANFASLAQTLEDINERLGNNGM